MTTLRHDSRGQGLLETIIALGVILAGTIGTISLLISTMNSGRESSNKVVATNLAREAIEAARNIRDSNWLEIEANYDVQYLTPGIQLQKTFEGLFNEDEVGPHHVRFPILYLHQDPAAYYGEDEDNNSWRMADVEDFKNYAGSTTGYQKSAYSDTISYQNSSTDCAYPALDNPNNVVHFPCSTVFQNTDQGYWEGEPVYHWWESTGYGLFNKVPEWPRPLLGNWSLRYGCNNAGNPACHIPPTIITGLRRWITFNPICRKDVDLDGIADINTGDTTQERIVTTDDGTADSKCRSTSDAANEVMVGLQAIATVAWGPQCPGKDCVQVEDWLYNWKYVK